MPTTISPLEMSVPLTSTEPKPDVIPTTSVATIMAGAEISPSRRNPFLDSPEEDVVSYPLQIAKIFLPNLNSEIEYPVPVPFLTTLSCFLKSYSLHIIMKNHALASLICFARKIFIRFVYLHILRQIPVDRRRRSGRQSSGRCL